MTKLQLLHRALNERLMAAVEQIMEMVGGTVLEYEVEMVRARKENEELRRRLRWTEGENPTDWPDIEIDTSGSGQPVIVIDEPVQNCPSITIEPINVSDLQSLIPDAKLAAAVSIRNADLEFIRPKTTEATNSGISNSMGWVSSLSYMAPLDCDPTTKSARGRSRSNKMSFACPDCGKVFGRKHNLMVHMRIHSADKPYAYRNREACFYGDKKRKRKPYGLLKPSKEIVEDKSDTAKNAGSATVCKPVATACSSLKAEPKKSKRSEIRAVEHVGRRHRQAFTKDNMHQCLECKKVFKKARKLAVHMKKHRKPQASQKEQDDNVEMNKMNEKSQEHSKLPQEEEIKTQDSNVRSDDSKTGSELPEAKTAEANENNLESEPISRGKKNPRGRIPVESTENTGHIERPFSCRECGKTYVFAGSLITHERSHIAKRLQKEKEKELPILLSRLREKRAKPQEQVAKKSRKNSTNGNEGGKPTYTCPFCDAVYGLRTRLMVHIQSHNCDKTYSYQEIKELFHGDRTSSRVPDSSSQEPAKENSDGNGGFAETESHAAVSQDHLSPSEPMESVEPQSARKFSVLPQQSSSATSNCITNQAGTGLKLNSTLTSYFRLQPRIVLQPVSVKSKICALPEERDLGLVKTDTSAHVPISSSPSDSLPKLQISDPEPVCVAFSDADSSDDNDWSDVLHNLDEDLAQQQTAPEKLADVETVDISHLESPQKDSDASSDVQFISESTEKHSAHDDLSNSDDIVATSVQVTGRHGGSTCTICGLKFASKPSLSQHMRIHSSPGHARRSVNFKASCNKVVNSETKVEQQVGGEQTLEAQEENSTSNFSEIMEEMDSVTVMEKSTSQSPTHDPDIDTSTISKGGSETQSKSRKPKKKSMERKVLHCRFCDKVCRKIELHLKFDHPREPEVIDALRRGKTAEERKRLLSGLCSLKSSKSSDSPDAALNDNLVHCLFCQGSYRRNQFWKHALVCKPKKAEEGSTVSVAADNVCVTKSSPENKSSKAEKSLEKQMKDPTSSTALEELANAPVPEDHHGTVQTTADPHMGNLSLDASSGDVQKTDPATANPCIRVSDSNGNIVPNLNSGCSPIQDGVPSETNQPSDPETSHVKEEMGKNGSDLGLRLDSDCTTVLKRKLDSQDSEIAEAKTKKKMQSDPLQPAGLDNNLSDEEVEAASQSMKTHTCPHCSPHQCTCSD